MHRRIFWILGTLGLMSILACTALGKMTVGGFLYYSEAIDRAAIDDQLYGGLKIGYSW